jgi:hypothetical protein
MRNEGNIKVICMASQAHKQKCIIENNQMAANGKNNKLQVHADRKAM